MDENGYVKIIGRIKVSQPPSLLPLLGRQSLVSEVLE